MHNSVGTFVQESRKKRRNPSLPTLKPELETKPKKGDEAQTITNESMETQVYRSCWHLSSQEQKTKPINAKPKEKLLVTNS